MPILRYGQKQAGINGSGFTRVRHNPHSAANTLVAGGKTFHPFEDRYLTIPEMKALCGFPADYKFLTYDDARVRLGNSVMPPMAQAIGRQIADYLNLLNTDEVNPNIILS